MLGGLLHREFAHNEHHMVHPVTFEAWAFFFFDEWSKLVTGRAETPLEFDSLTGTDHHRPVRSRVIPCVFPALASQLNCLPDQGCLLNYNLVYLPHGARAIMMGRTQCSNEPPCHAVGKSSVFEQVPSSETSRAVSANLFCAAAPTAQV